MADFVSKRISSLGVDCGMNLRTHHRSAVDKQQRFCHATEIDGVESVVVGLHVGKTFK